MSSAIYDTLILSDLHLGSEISCAEQATRMLRENRFRRLILLGDIFSDLNFGRLTKPHWKFLGYIRKLSNPKRGIEVVWVEGNHDRGLSQVMSHLVGVKVYEEYEWEFEGRRHLAIHGHQFDRFAVNNLFLSSVGTLLHLQLQKLDFKGKAFSRFLDRLGARWLRLSSKVASGAILHARLHQADRVFLRPHPPGAIHRTRRRRLLQLRQLDRLSSDLPDHRFRGSAHPRISWQKPRTTRTIPPVKWRTNQTFSKKPNTRTWLNLHDHHGRHPRTRLKP